MNVQPANNMTHGGADGSPRRDIRWRLAMWAVVVALVLQIPLVAMQFTDEVKWTPFDFIFMGVLLFGSALIYELVARLGSNAAYRAAVGLACMTGLVLVWVNGAVGIIGEVDEANVMYFGVILIGFVAACIARFEPRGMVRALVVTAVAQALVPLIALTFVPTADFAPGVGKVLMLNGFFVALWIGSALLFREAAPKPHAKLANEG